MLGRRLTVLFALAVSFTLAVPASASPPEKNGFGFVDVVDCGGGLTFDVDLMGEEIVHDMGDKLIINVNVHGGAVANDGTEIRVHHSWTEVVDFLEGTITVTGLPFGSWVQGGTARVLNRGRLVFDVVAEKVTFVAGHFTEDFNPEVLTCELIRSA